MAYKLALVGATGNVGREILRLIEDEQMLDIELILAASAASEGESLTVVDKDFNVISLDKLDFSKCDAAVFATPADVSEKYVPLARDAGAKVVDLSGVFAADEGAVLVEDKNARFLCVPDVAASILAEVLSAISKDMQPQSANVTALYPASFTGREAMDELFSQSAGLLGGAGAQSVHGHSFSAQIGFNVIPQVGAFKGAHTDAEFALMTQTNRLLDKPIPVTATALTVPTFVGVSVAANVVFLDTVDVAAIRDILAGHDYITVIDDPQKQEYSTPFGTAETDSIYVSRLRDDMLTGRVVQLWITCDNLRAASKLALSMALQ